MNIARIALAAVAATIVYFIIGGITFMLTPLRDEFLHYPAVYRSEAAMRPVFPIGIAAMFVAMIVLAVMYAIQFRGGSGLAQGARFGALVGLFAVCAFVLHNYVNLNIGLRLTVGQALAYFVEWVITGIVIGLIYRPAVSES